MTQPPDMDIQPARRSFWRNLSPVWLVPVLAVAVSLGIAWRSFNDRGVLVEITFQNAAGISPGETAVRLRDVPIGHVERVAFSPDLSEVIVFTRIDRTVAEVIPPDASFWVVRPEVSARGITGLTTVLSGVYIEASFLPGTDDSARRFTGLETAPLVAPGREGTRITLRAPDGNRLTPGAPVLYRGIQVGHIERPRLMDGLDGIVVDAFIEAPHDQRLTTATRFWDTSGFSVSLGPSGVRLSVGNLASLLTGGITFDTITSGGAPVAADMVFELYTDENAAREGAAIGAAVNALRVSAEFDGSVQGLNAGAQVRYRGVRVGEVTSISPRVTIINDTPSVRMQVSLALDPAAMGLADDAGPAELEQVLSGLVAEGLRAQLAPASFFRTSLVIELVERPEAPPATLMQPENGVPVIPSLPSDIPDLTATAQGMLGRINSLPIEDLLTQAISLMATAETLIGSDETRAAPGAVVALMDEARKLIGSADTQALPGDIRSAVAGLSGVLEALNEQKAVDRLVAALTAAEEAAGSVSTSVEDFPAIAEELRAVVQKADALEIEGLIASANKVLDSADRFINADGTQSLPPALTGALGEIEAALAELRAGGVVPNINSTLASASTAAEAVAEATKDLPQLAARLDRLVDQAEALVGAYGARSPVNEEILSALREARATARAFSQLARALERNPNSLLFGR
ncbi:paraquat-inducible protein B [Gemmobacter megaterium]|uniref:Paraquat-inducible protein B n=1 Tax=Gemmobacter megaterium TaxID=1086013 RepID=A0A1N7LP99_9RHOB|nr:MlaD family protein [Gemmobacter megaterium]GGE11345.1 paraquat-inducible protein B [Gemmobacter megaterium]SIS75683.1 paraquat-inducible protein B [Gemmobacter megaterium]